MAKTAFRRHAVDFEAIQWTGDNLAEMQEFCGVRTNGDWDVDANRPYTIPKFNRLGTYLVGDTNVNGGEVWDDDNEQWLLVNVGDWVVPQEKGFIPCTDEWMRINCLELDEQMLALIREDERPKSFQEELTSLINRHSHDSESGTPDFILARFLDEVGKKFADAVLQRAHWRGESVELPALKKLREKKVPLVVYTDGRRNEIGTAEVVVTPGEMFVTGTITGAIPIFGKENDSAAYSVEVPEKVSEEQVVGKDGGTTFSEPKSAFQRYQERGLSDS